MSLKQSKQIRSGAAVPSYDDQDCMTVTAEYTVVAGDAAGDIVEMHGIPSNSLIVDMIVHSDGVGSTVDVGLLSGELGSKDQTRTIGQELAIAAKTATAGVARLELNTIVIPKFVEEKPFGIKFIAAPTVGKSVRVSLTVQPAPVGL